MQIEQPPTIEEIEAIIALDDPGLRNLRITQVYHELAVALAGEFDAANVTWCAYATWASRTTGIFIRGENVEAVIRRNLRSSDAVIEDLDALNCLLGWFGQNTALDRLLLVQVLETVTADITRKVGHGNKIVFAELAPLYRRLLDLLAASEVYDPSALDEFLTHTTPGKVEEGGQDLLIQSFTATYQARFETEAKRRAELS